MSCDIHCHSEVKIKGEWHHLSDLDLDRDYALFSKMAGVQGSETPISEPRGIPEDVSFLTKFF